jgi:DNA-binding MarR family transcriptional regulator
MRIVENVEISFSAAAMPRPATTQLSDNSLDPDGEFPLGPPEYFFYLLFQTARQRDLFFDKELKPVGLNLAQWRSLAIIRRLETCTMTLLARYSTVERTTLTRAVDQLVARGLVQRIAPVRDRRQVNLSLTDPGKEVYRDAVAILKDRNEAVLAGIAPERLRDAARVLQMTLEKLAGDNDLAADLLNFGRTAPDSKA